MPESDLIALERIERDACADFYRAAPEAVRTAHCIEVIDSATATCVTCRGIEPGLVFRRAVGLGVARAASETELDEVLAHMNGLGLSYAISVAPHSRPATLSSWLEVRGLTQGYAWMKFARRCDNAPQVSDALELRVVASESSEVFGRIVAEGFGLPMTVAPWIGALAGRADWACVLASTAGTPVAAGAVYVSGDHAWLGFGATLPAHRRRGAQSALLARRLGEAAARGARIAVTETGERLPDKPSASYRNILRAGFEEAYLRQNYVFAPTD